MLVEAKGRTPIAAGGEPVYHARDHANYRHITARDVGNGLVVLDTPTRGVIVDDVRVDGAYRVIENTGAGRMPAPCTGLRVSNVTATDLRRGFARIRYASRDGLFADITASGGLTTGAHDLPCGIAIADEASDFRFERCTMRGFRWKRKDAQYWNGDGFSAERGNKRLIFRNCAAWGNSDGGFDLKASDSLLDDCVSGRNARNYRLWSSIRATRLTSIEPVKIGGIGDTVHFALMGAKTAGGAPIVIRIAHLSVRSTKAWPLFDVHDGPVRIIIDSHDINVPTGTPLIRPRGKGSVPGGIQWGGPPPRL
ncbi:conserved hypothetical protein [Sphingomonas sp. EC-HK361]|uniref:hypothetical protein n=1 Tax=Sphingomonas sp. EC-HK361 TaxID=2038397 RepID=UPI001254C915|nr:hypothetical protein [Sphingomonas sp. EC-HK361]VVT00183.1 conserved hypothetical protein [Sphingomonas sp. EC-HK361]